MVLILGEFKQFLNEELVNQSIETKESSSDRESAENNEGRIV